MLGRMLQEALSIADTMASTSGFSVTRLARQHWP